MAWTFALQELGAFSPAAVGAVLGEIDKAKSRQLTLPLNGLPSASFTIDLDNSLAQQITDRKGDVLLKIYQDGTLRFIGDCMTVEETVNTGGGLVYTRKIDRQGLINDAYSLNPEYPNAVEGSSTPDVRSAADTTSYNARGLYQEVISSDIIAGELRQALVNSHVAIRKTARQEVGFQSGSDGDNTLTATFVGPLWRLQKRVMVDYQAAGWTRNTTAHAIIQELVTYANGFLDIGIRNGTFDTFYTVSIGPYYFKPLSELLTELQVAGVASPIETPPSYVAIDDGSGTGSITGSSDDAGNTWSTSGAGPEWQRGGGFFSRIFSGGGEGFAVNSYSLTGACIAGWSFASSADSLGADLFCYFAGYPRYVDANNYVRAVVDFGSGVGDGSLVIQKRLGGTLTEINRLNFFSPFHIAAETTYKMRFLITSGGNYSVWLYQSGTTFPSPSISGQDDDLASTATTLNAGKLAFGDNNSTSPATSLRFDWDDVFLSSYGADQVFDFELAPSEPTLDTNQSGVSGNGVKIATLNMRSRIGTDKPEVIFDTNNTPRFGTDYIVGDKITARSVVGGNTQFNGLVRVYGVDISIDENGKEQIVPRLIPDS